VRKQAALQQLGQTCPGLVRLGWLGHAGPGAQTRPKLPDSVYPNGKLRRSSSPPDVTGRGIILII